MLDRHYHISFYEQAVVTKQDQRVADLEAVYLKALELRDFEITQLVQRNNFFMVFQGVLLAGILQSEGNIPAVSAIVSTAGCLMSVAQYRMAAGAKFWQQRWETELSETEEALAKAYRRAGREWSRALFYNDEAKTKVKKGFAPNSQLAKLFIDPIILDKPSVSRIPIYTGAILVVTWLAIAAWFALQGLST
jgi:hypothetical protein